MSCYIVAGGAGFIGSEFVRQLLKDDTTKKVYVIDKLTYAGRRENLKKNENFSKFEFIEGDILDSSNLLSKLPENSTVVNFAAESHVDKSIVDPYLFAETNSQGVVCLADSAKKNGMKKLVQVSTDEVYGSLDSGEFDEKSALNPSSPYSASKAAGDLLALSFWRTYKFPVVITRGVNTFGPGQYPEKLIPLAITRFKKGLKIPIYGSGLQQREWIHVYDHAKAIFEVSKLGRSGEIYNIGTGSILNNLEIVRILANQFSITYDYIEFVEDRKGHDFRYALNSSKIRKEMNWSHTVTLNENSVDFTRW